MVEQRTRLLPLHKFLTALEDWHSETPEMTNEGVQDALNAVVDAYGVLGAYVAVNASSLPALNLGVGSLTGANEGDAAERGIGGRDLELEGAPDGTARIWIDGDTEPADALAAAVEITLDAVSSRHQARLHRQQLEALDSAVRGIAEVQSVDKVLQLIVDRVRELIGAEYAALGIVGPFDNIEQFVTSGLSPVERERIGELPEGHGLLGLIIQEDSSFLIDDIATDHRRYGFPPNHPEMHSFLGAPVRSKGRSIGNLYLTNKMSGATFSAADLRLVEMFALHAGIAMENARLHAEVQRLAVGDERQRISQDLHDSMGAGDQDVQMFNFKLAKPLGEGELTAYYNTSDRVEIDYQDLSKDIVARRGRDWDNWFPDWFGAVAAGNACNASGGNDTIACDDAYWNASGLRKDDLGYVAFDLPFGESLEWKTTAYFHQNEGQGLWGTPYMPTPGGAPLSIRTTEYDLKREGVISALTWTAGAHEVNGGIWYETNDFTQARRFYGEPNIVGPTRSFEGFQRNPMRTDWEYDFDTETVVLHLQDHWSLSDAVRLNYGFRSVNQENHADTVVGDVKTGTIEADEPFLPQIGINWALSNDSSGSLRPRRTSVRSPAAERRDRSARRRRDSTRSATPSSPRRRPTSRPGCGSGAARSMGSWRSITWISRIGCSASRRVPASSATRRCSRTSAA